MLTLLLSVLIACAILIMVACPEPKPESSSKNTPSPSSFTAGHMVSAGYYHTVGIKGDGTLWAWGGNNNSSSPVQVGSDNWKAVSTRLGHTVGIKADGTLWAWGRNGSGQLGDGTKTHRSSPVQVVE